MAGAEKSKGGEWRSTGKLLIRLLLRGRSQELRAGSYHGAGFTITTGRLSLAALLTTRGGERAQNPDGKRQNPADGERRGGGTEQELADWQGALTRSADRMHVAGRRQRLRHGREACARSAAQRSHQVRPRKPLFSKMLKARVEFLPLATQMTLITKMIIILQTRSLR